MAKNNIIAVVALTVVAIFAAPAAAQAAYVPAENTSVSGTATEGGTVAVGFADGSFAGSETVSFSVTGEGRATLSVFMARETVSLEKTAGADGSVSVTVTLPENATGSYTVTATGLTSGNVGTAALTVAAVDAGSSASNDDSLATTGASDITVLLIWSAAGVLLLGVALVVVMGIVRRQRANA
ncbi:MAG: Sortase sorted surface protein [Microbacteriaceae bacterium]|jgi:hypothetical protein|nr:Sortase sorted surface protein [Microbacteriaceae bacterium]